MRSQVIALFSALVLGVTADLGKSESDYPDGYRADGDIWAATKNTPWTAIRWTNNLIPQACKDEILRDNKGDPATTTVYEIQYEDCNMPWVFCRTQDASMDLHSLATMFGRLPVHARSLIRHVVATAKHSDSPAYAVNGEILMQPAADGYKYISIWFHETGHHLGFHNGFTQSQQWKDAINADSCTPSPYGDTNVDEDFAENSVYEWYNILYGHLKDGEEHPGCWDNQRRVLESVYRNDYMNFGGTCGARWDNSPSVPKSGNAAVEAPKLEKPSSINGVPIRTGEPNMPLHV